MMASWQGHKTQLLGQHRTFQMFQMQHEKRNTKITVLYYSTSTVIFSVLVINKN